MVAGARDKPVEKAAERWKLRLYVAGMTEHSALVLANLRQVCDEQLAGHYDLEVIDLLKHPELAAGDQIVALPTLVRELPPPARKIIGDLSRKDHVLVGLDLRPAEDKA